MKRFFILTAALELILHVCTVIPKLFINDTIPKVLGAESFVFQFAIEKAKDQDI